MKTVLDISGMHCASCASTLEHSLKRITGVTKVSVSYAAGQAEVDHGTAVSRQDLVNQVQELGYDVVQGEKQPEDDGHGIFVVLVMAAFLLIFSMGSMIGLPIPHTTFTVFIELVLASAILWMGRSVYKQGVLSAFSAKRANMDSLISIGTAAAYLYSLGLLLYVFATGQGVHHAYYFESAGLIMAFVLLGRHLETRARNRTKHSLNKLLSLTPQTARLMKNKKEQEVAVSDVKQGDVLKVKPGDRIPVDGVITVGNSRVDESMFSGEPTPVKKGRGDDVFAGTINNTGMFLMQTTHTGTDTAFHRIVELVRKAQRSQAPVARLADTISAYFVPVVLVIALAAFGFWLIAGQTVGFALTVAIAVLIIACPCALGLATPMAIMVSTGSAARKGVLFKDAKAIQKAAEVRMVAFDKTGTLTQGKPEVVYIKAYNDVGVESMLRYAASLESASEHPLGEAIVRAAEKKKVRFGEPRSFESIAGRGVIGKVEGRKIVIGNVEFFKEQDIGLYDVRERLPELAKKGLTPVLVGIEGRISALIGVRDPLKDSAKQGVLALHDMNVSTVLLTGDQEQTAVLVAKEVGIEVVRAGLTPEQKLSELKKLQRKRAVAMVGDGINDAPALAQADVGIAIGQGTDVAIESGDVVLIKNDVRGVATALGVARKTMRVVKQNLGWAFAYNLVALPIAVGALYPTTGWLLNPALAGFAMAASSLSVVLNSSRLR